MKKQVQDQKKIYMDISDKRERRGLLISTGSFVEILTSHKQIQFIKRYTTLDFMTVVLA